MKQLDEKMFVAGQIWPDDMTAIKAAGVTAILNNRPDEEEPGQPSSAEIEGAARAAGLAYSYIPVSAGFSPEQIEAMATALGDAPGPVLAFCRSGTRSTFLWALSESRRGETSATLVGKAAAAGYDLRPIAAYLDR